MMFILFLFPQVLKLKNRDTYVTKGVGTGGRSPRKPTMRTVGVPRACRGQALVRELSLAEEFLFPLKVSFHGE